ncbi:2-dehydropantoate 2-reductase [Streptomyces sp. NPDC059881]|uniref:2-dehydropantoate 2-reductase n=1 Tax=Streptomyces sp. NPDC059881 TaxID=3346986 RepID=UPI00365DD608
MKAAVIGAGGVGGYFGGRLADAGHEVHFVARGAQLDALRHEGLTVASPAGDFSVAPVRVTDDPRDIGEVDYVFLCVKTRQLPDAVKTLTPLMGPDTAVLPLQNGVEAPAEVADAVGRGAVLPGIAKIIAFLDGPGRVRHVGGQGSLTFGEWDNGVTPRVERLRAALDASAVTAVVPDDIWTELWAKFLFVVPLGGLGAVTDATIGEFRSRPGTRRLLVEAMTEIQHVAQAHGIRLPDGIVPSTLAIVDQQPAVGTSSMHRDIASGRPSELEAWTGAVVRLGERSGTPTPVNSFLYEVLSLRESRATGTTG